MLNRIERYLGRFAINNLTLYLIVLTGTVSAIELLALKVYNINLGLGDISGQAINSGKWWNLLLYPFCIRIGPIWLLLHLYMLWIFGRPLEEYLGAFKYTIYVFLGLFLITLGTFFTPPQIQVGAQFVEYSIFFACAYIAPNMEIVLFPIFIPVRIKWIALIVCGFVIFSTFQIVTLTGSLHALLSPIIGFGSFLLFFGPEIVRNVGSRSKSRIRKKKYDKGDRPMHVCTICGITERDDSNAEFRYCVDCDDHEYCMDHLHSHEHIRKR